MRHNSIVQYYTDYDYGPVRGIASASTTGHGTNGAVYMHGQHQREYRQNERRGGVGARMRVGEGERGAEAERQGQGGLLPPPPPLRQ